MFFVFTLFAFLSFASFADLNCDYTLSFNQSDLYFLKKVIYWSDSKDKNCTQDMKQKAIDAFIRYGHKHGFAPTTWSDQGTQFGKVHAEYQPEGIFHQILLDPIKFKLPSDTQLAINIHLAGIFKPFRFTLSPAMQDLVEKMLKEDNSTQSKV